MHERDRAEGRLAGGGEVELDAKTRRERAFVHRGQLHPEIMRMLAVNERLALVALAALQQQRIAAVGDGCRIQAEHRSSLHPPTEDVTTRHHHRPVERAELLIAAWSALRVVL